ESAVWEPTTQNAAVATTISTALGAKIEPAIDEASYDAISMLQRGNQAASSSIFVPLTSSDIVVGAADAYPTFADVADPIDNGTATVRRIHADAMARLRAWNAQVVAEQANATPSVESMIVTARLSLIRDFALTAAQTT
ncbi:hypothetical protein ACO1GT_14565, partial [Staphylococcus arlettae]